MQAVHELKHNKLRLEERKTLLEEFKLDIITKDEYSVLPLLANPTCKLISMPAPAQISLN